jgi:hypothetical protein
VESPPWGYVYGYAARRTIATADTLEIDLTGGHSAYYAPHYGWSEQASASISFDLTEQSLIQLSGSADTAELLDSNGNVILTLPFPSSPTLLSPGNYFLDASAASSGLGGFASDVSEIDFNTSLYASFTSVAVPEPRGTLLAALLASMLGGYVMSRRHLSRKAR